MHKNLFWIIDHAINKWLRFYRRKVFEAHTGQITDGCSILGPMTLINPNIRIGKNVTFYPNVMLWGDGPILIGDNVDIGANSVLYAFASGGGITIGDSTLIAANCYITDSNHGTCADMLIQKQPMEAVPVTIGSDVWIGAGCQILKGAEIGAGAVIGAGSIVTKDIPENAVAFGVRAEVHSFRK